MPRRASTTYLTGQRISGLEQTCSALRRSSLSTTIILISGGCTLSKVSCEIPSRRRQRRSGRLKVATQIATLVLLQVSTPSSCKKRRGTAYLAGRCCRPESGYSSLERGTHRYSGGATIGWHTCRSGRIQVACSDRRRIYSFAICGRKEEIRN